MEIKVLEQDVAVCQVENYTQVNWAAEFCFTGKTDEEYSLACATADVPDNVIRRDDGWKGFRIQGVLDFRFDLDESGALRKGAGRSQAGGIYNREVEIPL